MQEQQPVYTSGLVCFSTSPRQTSDGYDNPYHTHDQCWPHLPPLQMEIGARLH